MLNEVKKWKILTEDGDSYPKPYTAVFAEDEEGAQYVASCDTEFKWYVSLGEETHYIPDYIEIVRWRPVESTEKPDLAWPIDLAETLAVELEPVIDRLEDAGNYDITAKDLAEKVIDDIKLVHNQLWELHATLKKIAEEKPDTPAAPAEEPLCSYEKCLTCNISTCYTGKVAREQGEEAYHAWIAEMAEAEEIPSVRWFEEDKAEYKEDKTEAIITKIRLTGSGEGELETSKRILNFLYDVKEHKLDGTIAELGINVMMPKGYSSSVFLSIHDGELETSVCSLNGFIRVPFEFPYPGRDMGKTLYERWDIIEKRIYKAKEEQEKVWNSIKPGDAIYQRRPFDVEKIIPLTVTEKYDDFLCAEDEFGYAYQFISTSTNVKIFADRNKAEAWLHASPVGISRK